MRNVVLSMMMLLDGFAAGPNDEMDWSASAKEAR
jgi:hypothetical protein